MKLVVPVVCKLQSTIHRMIFSCIVAISHTMEKPEYSTTNRQKNIQSSHATCQAGCPTCLADTRSMLFLMQIPTYTRLAHHITSHRIAMCCNHGARVAVVTNCNLQEGGRRVRAGLVLSKVPWRV